LHGFTSFPYELFLIVANFGVFGGVIRVQKAIVLDALALSFRPTGRSVRAAHRANTFFANVAKFDDAFLQWQYQRNSQSPLFSDSWYPQILQKIKKLT